MQLSKTAVEYGMKGGVEFFQKGIQNEFAMQCDMLLRCLLSTVPSYPMGPGPPSLRGPQTADALFFHLVK